MSTAKAKKNSASYLAEKKSKRNRVITWVCVLLAVVILVGLSTVSILNDKGLFLRNHVALASENFEVNDAMLAYFTYTYYMNFYSMYSMYMSAFGIDPAYPLNMQSGPSGGTWLDYFADAATSEAKQLMGFAEAAKEAGLSLDEEDQKSIDDSVSEFVDYAKEANITVSSIIGNTLGFNGVSESDIRSALELSQLASKMQTKLTDEYDLSDEAIDAYFNENKTSFTTVDYLKYTVKADLTKVDQTSETFEQDLKDLYDATRAQAEELAGCKTEEDFKGWITRSLEGSEQSVIDAALKNVVSQKVSYSEDSPVSEWAFAATAGDKYIDDTTEGSYVVYVLTTAARPDASPSEVTIDAINFVSEKDAKDAWESFSATAKDEDAFKALAESLNKTGYENVVSSANSLDTAMAEYILNYDRQPGESNFITYTDSTGYAIVLIKEISDVPFWKASVKGQMASEYLDEKATENTEKYPITDNGHKF